MTIEVSESAGVRYLHFGSHWIQGAMRVARPWALELDYTREMMAALLLRPDPEWPRSALLTGLGAASLQHTLGELKAHARALRETTGLNLLPTLARLEQANRCPAGKLRF